MSGTSKPSTRPARPWFSSGPCAKRPGWEPVALADAAVGRSHRAKPASDRLREVIEASKRILGLPDGYRLGVVPGSDTGAFEMALWSLLGERGIDLGDVQGWLGHRDIMTTRRHYAPVLVSRLKQASETLSGRFGGWVTEPETAPSLADAEPIGPVQ